MDRKAVNGLFITAAVIAIVTSAPISAIRNINAASFRDQAKTEQVTRDQSAPTVLAQGRCINGQCY
jgi:hypothetical protein